MAGVDMFQHAKSLGVNRVFDDDADRTVTKNVDNGPTTLLSLFVANASAELDYVHLWDDTNPVIGTDAQDHQFPIPNGETHEILFKSGGKFVNGLSWAASQTGGTGAATAPTTPIDIYASTTGGN